MYTVSEDFGGFAAGFPHPWIRFVPLFPPRFFCSWVTAWVKTLSRWAGTDRILVEEFNDNWDKIDTALKGNADGVAALQTALAGAGNCEIGMISYTGTGKSGDSNPTTVTFPKMPAGFFLCGAETYLVIRGGDDHACMIYYTGSTTYVSQMPISWKGNQFQISSSKPTYQLNEEGVPYWGLAFYQKS